LPVVKLSIDGEVPRQIAALRIELSEGGELRHIDADSEGAQRGEFPE